mmetsp:Transcript_6526/g.832  ORF Transcript_6526/g.832 Transcript_6526/m.832 type:complete len:97 (+) Transcript_6526:698-988(+)
MSIKRSNCAVKIQMLVRRFLIRCSIRRKNELKNAIIILRAYNSYLSKQIIKDKIHDKESVKVKAAIRGFKQRRRYRILVRLRKEALVKASMQASVR